MGEPQESQCRGAPTSASLAGKQAHSGSEKPIVPRALPHTAITQGTTDFCRYRIDSSQSLSWSTAKGERPMNVGSSKRVIALILLAVIIMLSLTTVAIAAPNVGAPGPGAAPNSGDGVSDGSGFIHSGAPNSGDGVPDGSGW